MAIRTPKELFVLLLSHAREGTERSATAYDELSEVAQHPEIKEALEARAFVANQTLERLDQVFKMIGEKPVNVTGRLRKSLSKICARNSPKSSPRKPSASTFWQRSDIWVMYA